MKYTCMWYLYLQGTKNDQSQEQADKSRRSYCCFGKKKIYCTTYMYIILFSQDFICLQFDRIFPFEASLYHQYLVLFIFSGIPVADKRLESQANFKK